VLSMRHEVDYERFVVGLSALNSETRYQRIGCEKNEAFDCIDHARTLKSKWAKAGRHVKSGVLFLLAFSSLFAAKLPFGKRLFPGSVPHCGITMHLSHTMQCGIPWEP
jgi:hypothetical protein